MFKSIYTTRMIGNGKVLKTRFEKINAKPVKGRKLITFICTILLLFVCIFSTLVMAKVTNEGDYTLEITNNGVVIELKNKPFINNGEVYVPLRELFEKLDLMVGENAKMEWDNGVVLISLYQKNLNEDAVADYTSYLYKIEIGMSELVVNPKVLMVKSTPDEITSVIEPMDNAPILKKNITYIPFSYAERMAERADLGFLSPKDLYKLDVVYSGEILSIIYPIEGYYVKAQGFGSRVHPITGEETFHTGIDFKAEEKTPVLAGIEGKFQVGYDNKKGAYMTISNKLGVEVTYCHLDSEILDKIWRVMWVDKGDIIGYVGNTGMSTGPHLHMEVKINGEYVNPELYLQKSRYDELLIKIADDVPRMLERTGYKDADYKIIDIDYTDYIASIKVQLYNYDNEILSIFYDYAEEPYGWTGMVATEAWNSVNFDNLMKITN